MIIFLFVGTIFIVVVLLLLAKKNYYRQHSNEEHGRVIGIEKKVNHSRSSNGSSTTVTYRPIIEYYFKGQRIWFSPSSSSSNDIFKYKISQTVKLLSLNRGPEYVVLKTNHTSLLSAIFLILGTVFVIIPFFHGSSLVFNLIGLFFIFLTFFSLFTKMKNKKISLEKIYDKFLQSARIETEESLQGREIYRSNKEIDEVVSSIHNAGFIISLLFFLMSSSAVYYFWRKLDPAVKNTIIDTLNDIGKYQKIVDILDTKNSDLIGLIAALFFALLSSYGLLNSLVKKMNL